jgi:hypothetical protein
MKVYIKGKISAFFLSPEKSFFLYGALVNCSTSDATKLNRDGIACDGLEGGGRRRYDEEGWCSW